MAKKVPFLPDFEMLERTGIIQKYLEYKGQGAANLHSNMKRIMRITDETDAISRYTHYNLPFDFDSAWLERMLYYYPDLCVFYFEPLKKFLCLPYAGDDIDLLGRFVYATPIPFANGDESEDSLDAKETELSSLKLKILYAIPSEEELADLDITKVCVLIHDYPYQRSQKNALGRWALNDPLLDIEAECLCFGRTARLLSTGVEGVRVAEEDGAGNVEDANRAIEKAAREGKPYIPIVNPVEMQELQNGAVAKGEEFMLALQSLDNFRLSSYGIENGGVFKKMSHELNAEQAITNSPVYARLVQGLAIRQNAWTIFNAITGAGVWCEIAEEHSMIDANADGIPYTDNQGGENSGMNMNEGGSEDDR